ncbi:MAG: tetratricopeptide repeat protein, partial [Treponemataceae bacterium]|nr:tetratricopeptide repeat protein [Treponemataceae bacterium]
MMKNSPVLLGWDALKESFFQYYEQRRQVTRLLQEQLEGAFLHFSPRPTVKSRTKDFESFYKKYVRLIQNSSLVPPKITDLIGLRIVCTFIEDVQFVEDTIRKLFVIHEIERKGSQYSFKEFGYESTHVLIRIPDTILQQYGPLGCDVAEIQIRTILQDAWAEVEHELVYKAEFTPFDEPMKRKLAAVNASLSLADIIFQEIRDYQRQLNRELDRRRESFYKKVEDVTDRGIFDQEETPELKPSIFFEGNHSRESLDDLLLDALYAHNQGNCEEAIALYTRILETKPPVTVAAVIYKHRAMAYFAESHYEKAIHDFTRALELDPKSYKAAYFRGIVYALSLIHI